MIETAVIIGLTVAKLIIEASKNTKSKVLDTYREAAKQIQKRKKERLK
jgi:hypothetical protein